MFPISKCRGDRELGLCTTSEIVFGEQMRDSKIQKKKTCFDAGKIGLCHCAAVLQEQVPKLCTELDLSLLYILLGTYTTLPPIDRVFPLCVSLHSLAGEVVVMSSRHTNIVE